MPEPVQANAGFRFAWRGLGYVGIAAPDPEAWRDFAVDVCGLMPARYLPGTSTGAPQPDAGARGLRADGTLFLKMDDRAYRLAVHPSGARAPSLAYLGLELPGLAALDAAAEQLAREGVDVERGGAALCAERGVGAVAVLRDPAGHRIELFAGPLRDRDFVSPHAATFLTGALGMGHAVLHVADVDAALDFYCRQLGFLRSDYMVFAPGAGIHFLRCTRRHHSLALLQLGPPGPAAGLQHLMFEVTTLDDVGRALDRARNAGVPITSELGRHRNDEVVSFYMRGPSGFDVEIGWDGVLVGDDWVEHEFTGGGDVWGHRGLGAAVGAGADAASGPAKRG